MIFKKCDECQSYNENEMANLRVAMLVCSGIFLSTYLPDVVDYFYLKIADFVARYR